MEDVSRSSLGELKSVFKSSEDNVYYYRLLLKLNDLSSDFEFAQPVIQSGPGYIVWRSKYEGSFHKYSDLTDETLKNLISIKVQNALLKLEKKLENYKEVDDFYNKVTEIPRDSSIFYSYHNNDIVVTLTEWGFFLDEFRKVQGILKKAFPASLQSFIINFRTITGERVPNINIELNYNNTLFYDKSDFNGVVKLNNVSKDSFLTVKSLNNDFSDVHAKINDTNELDVIIDKKVDLHFKVENSLGKPIVKEEFSFISQELGSLNFTTDEKGNFILSHSTSNNNFKILHNDNNLLLDEKIPTSDSSYTIVLDNPNNDKDEIPYIEDKAEIEETISVQKNITIELLDHNNNPIQNHSVDFYGVGGKSKYVTDGNGKFIVSNLEEGIDYALFLDYKKTNWKKDFSHKFNTDKYTFIVKSRRFLWWWLPLLIFAVFFFLIPIPINHTFKTIDANTKKPIEGVLIHENLQNSFSTLNNHITDSNGKLKLNYGNETMFSQLISNFNTNITAQKNDYHILIANVPLGFFRRWRSNLHLDKDSLIEANLPIEEYLPCNSGEGYNDDGNQLYRFDLGKSNTEFLFEYYNDTHLDIISVYCEDGSLLFREGNTTDTDYFSHSAKIFAPCRFIEVEVEGDSNWGIKVNCP